MSLRRDLRDRRLPAATIAVALAAGVAQLLLWWFGPAPKTSDFVGPPRSSYTLTNARMTEFNAAGQPSFRLQSPHLERREGDDSLYLNSPTFQLPANQAGVPDWQGQSLYGWVNKDGSQLKLQGPVEMHREAFVNAPAARIQTADVTAWPKQNRLETAAPAQMVQGGTRISGIGMRADLNDKHLELLDDVHATFPPRKR
ncbi:LPS export ABC transporter periplasmic protein LptC [Rhodanobacter sp. Soil772]|uniref:LPS export ABC transporter periplasmic protein LptC n=1 Tax=Rhodanobacter sp. Soil772 TaxID=1736406 RepID=UPI0006F5EC91|nr:LPS export ABC transporter periplasmic protein LptC [Rhodanobacter sp. Soil772]KRE84808.1 LPS export ABC transporter periplasmic protein LptC [Rhodanobacter sp. Soil772]